VNQTQHHRDFARAIQQLSHRHPAWRVYSDFCEMAALALANAVSTGPLHEKREQRYLEIVRGYSQQEARQIAQLLGIVTEALEVEPFDFLGEMFMSLELFNHWKGQYFTPSCLTQVMAALTLDESLTAAITERGFVTVQEPACGSGATVIGLALALRQRKLNYQQQLHVTAVDVDSTAAHMAFIQLSLLHIPAVVVIGNTLTLEQRDAFHTPSHVLGLWDNKLRRGYALGSRADLAWQPKPAPLDLSKLTQGDLFGQAQDEAA
jgi:hypothetical protein